MKRQLLLIILIISLFMILFFKKHFIEKFTTFNAYCQVPELLNKVLEDKSIKKDSKNYDFYIPCSYNSCEKDILKFENTITGKKLFLIDGCDWIGSKFALWKLIKERYGDDANKYMPQTFLLDNIDDVKLFKSYYKPNQMYVLKNYEQRQQGIKLTKNLEEILSGYNNGWYLVQDYIYNPFIINNRKINFRYYLLVVCKNGTIQGYIHKDGFMYYTPKFYDPNDIDFDKHITTGYIDRKVYTENPLTLDDFRDYLDNKSNLVFNRKPSIIFDYNGQTLMNKIMDAISFKICKNPKLYKHTRFQLFGCDLAPDAQLNMVLMEINKGPDMNAKDERDKQVKYKVQEDILTLLDQEDLESTRFIRIY